MTVAATSLLTVTAVGVPSGTAAARRRLHAGGRLTRANWDARKDVASAKRAVKLQFRTASGTYATVKTVTRLQHEHTHSRRDREEGRLLPLRLRRLLDHRAGHQPR